MIHSKIEKRVFVVGVPRSGTTLVQSLLAAHGAMTSFTESHFFDRHFNLLPPLPNPILTRDPVPRLKEFLAENEEEAPEAALRFESAGRRALRMRLLLPFQSRWVARQLLEVFDELAQRRGSSSWIEKTPRHLRYIPFLGSLPGVESRTYFVHVIREGLEVVASLREASKSWERPYDLESCVRRWNEDVAFSLGRITAPTDHFIFYEELTSRPEPTLRRLIHWLGLDWESDIFERYGRTADRLVTRQEAWKADVGRRIGPSGTADRALTAEQREWVTRSLSPGLYDRFRERVERQSGIWGDAG